MITDDWHNLYSGSWKNLITPQAFSHPAKFSRKLIEFIYKHAIEEGWVKSGDVCLDCFGGVGLGALDAMRNGLVWVGCELEQRFVDLGNKNIDLWNKRYSSFPNWGKAYLLQGDSRKLIEVIRKADIEISSPPYADSIKPNGDGIDWSKIKGEENRENSRTNGRGAIADGYSQNSENLGNMKDNPDSYAMAISSPPYADIAQSGGTKGLKEHGTGLTGKEACFAEYGNDPAQLGKMQSTEDGYNLAVTSPPFVQVGVPDHKGQTNSLKGKLQQGGEGFLYKDYGDTPGNLGNMKNTGLDLALSSPPYSETRISGNGDEGTTGLRNEDGTYLRGTEGWEKRKELGARYGNSDGNLGNLKDAGLDVSISSPPFSEPNNQPCIGQGVRKDLEAIGKNPTARYGNSDGNLGNMDMGVSSPPFEDKTACQDPNYATGRKNGGGPLHGDYGNSSGQLGQTVGNDFWSSARQIVEQVYTILKPGAHSIWIVKAYIKKGQIVDFPNQWRLLCEAVGFQTVHIHKAWLIEDKGTQFTLDGGEVHKTIKRASFFRRLAESKGSPRIDWETVICMSKPQ